jgi:hypothetical protein
MRLVRIVVCSLLMAAAIVLVPRPAAACACGAVISNSTAAVSGETSLITWDGSTETIDMVLLLQGSAADAAWIMPVPPGTVASLGDRAVFGKLVTATAPRVERQYTFWPSFGFGGNGSVSGAQRPGGLSVTTSEVGPFTVSTLSGTDPEAVNTWLADHGYPTKPALTATFAEYLADGWSIDAVKLTSPGGQLAGSLDPLRMTFTASAPVYPIKLSRHARDVQGVTLYIAAAHRMEITREASPGSYVEPIFAGKVAAADLGLKPLDGQDVYLTAFTQVLQPSSITDDYLFGRAADDRTYQRVTYETVDMGWVPVLGAIVVLVGVAALVVVVAIRQGQSRSTWMPNWPRR